jgi:hypothetical protein
MYDAKFRACTWRGMQALSVEDAIMRSHEYCGVLKSKIQGAAIVEGVGVQNPLQFDSYDNP